MRISKKIYQAVSIILLTCMQLSYADTVPFSAIEICSTWNCGDIRLTNQREILTVKNNSIYPVTINYIAFENLTTIDKGIGLAIEPGEFISPYLLPGQSNYDFIINTTYPGDRLAPVKIIAAYNDSNGEEKIATAEIHASIDPKLFHENYLQPPFESIISDDNINPHKTSTTTPHTTPNTTYEGNLDEVHLKPLQMIAHYLPNLHKQKTTSAIPHIDSYTITESKNRGLDTYVFDDDYKIEYIHPPKAGVLKFKKPGIKTFKIINDWDSEVTIKRIFFNADQFSLYPILRSFAIQGFAPNSKLPRGAWYELQIKAEENASTSIYPGGTQFFIVYTVMVNGEEKERAAEFRVKIDYNDEVEFDVRNLEFTSLERKFTETPCPEQLQYSFINNPYNLHDNGTSGKYFYQAAPTVKKLIIKNKSPSPTIKVTNVSLDQDKAGVHIGNYSSCSSLEAGKSCEVDITVDHEATDEAVPVYVTYHTNDKEVVATAAIIIKRKSDNIGINPDDIITPLINSAAKETVKSTFGVIKKAIYDKGPGGKIVGMLGTVAERNVEKDLGKILYLPIPLLTKIGYAETFAGVVKKPKPGVLTNHINSIGKTIAKGGYEIIGGKITNLISPKSVFYYFKYMGVELAAGGIALSASESICDFLIGYQGEYLPERWENAWLFRHKKTINSSIATIVKMGGLVLIGPCDTALEFTMGVISEIVVGLDGDRENYEKSKKSLGRKGKSEEEDTIPGGSEYIDCTENNCQCGYQTS